jgi:membrane protein implicated in regulation of membrane protease activity
MESKGNMINPAYFWLAVGFILMTAEVVTPGFILFFFGLAAVLVGILCFFIPLSETLQLLLFAVLSIITLLTLRRQMKAIFTGRSRDGAASFDDACIGRHAIVTARIAAPIEGRVELNGVLWNATADEVLEAGTPVVVAGRDGLSLTVRRRS